MELLKSKNDHYDGIIIDEKSLSLDIHQFKNQLKVSLNFWKEKGKKGIWLKIPKENAILIPIALEFGFEIHHAQKTYIMLTKWIPNDIPSTIPNYASFYIGVGGFVYNPLKKEVLVVKEKNGPIKGVWKMPGGLVEPGEDLCDAVIREVLEETGIQCKFMNILAFRQANNFSFGLSDLYFVCRLEPLTFHIQLQEEEISECKWISQDEFFSLPHYKGVYKKLLEIAQHNIHGLYGGFDVDILPTGINQGYNKIYYQKSNPKL